MINDWTRRDFLQTTTVGSMSTALRLVSPEAVQMLASAAGKAALCDAAAPLKQAMYVFWTSGLGVTMAEPKNPRRPHANVFRVPKPATDACADVRAAAQHFQTLVKETPAAKTLFAMVGDVQRPARRQVLLVTAEFIFTHAESVSREEWECARCIRLEEQQGIAKSDGEIETQTRHLGGIFDRIRRRPNDARLLKPVEVHGQQVHRIYEAMDQTSLQTLTELGIDPQTAKGLLQERALALNWIHVQDPAVLADPDLLEAQVVDRLRRQWAQARPHMYEVEDFSGSSPRAPRVESKPKTQERKPEPRRLESGQAQPASTPQTPPDPLQSPMSLDEFLYYVGDDPAAIVAMANGEDWTSVMARYGEPVETPSRG